MPWESGERVRGGVITVGVAGLREEETAPGDIFKNEFPGFSTFSKFKLQKCRASMGTLDILFLALGFSLVVCCSGSGHPIASSQKTVTPPTLALGGADVYVDCLGYHSFSVGSAQDECQERQSNNRPVPLGFSVFFPLTLLLLCGV